MFSAIVMVWVLAVGGAAPPPPPAGGATRDSDGRGGVGLWAVGAAAPPPPQAATAPSDSIARVVVARAVRTVTVFNGSLLLALSRQPVNTDPRLWLPRNYGAGTPPGRRRLTRWRRVV